jgi:hypothetical protein
MNAYEQKLVARKVKLEDRAAKARSESETTYQRARGMAAVIPFGQPILIGHHSEKRDRNFRNRIHDTYGKAFALQDKAAYYESKAASVGTGGISSDDPEAIIKLKEQLANVRASQETMKKANALLRKHRGDDVAQISAIAALDSFTEATARELVKPDCCGRIGFPSYALSNNNANARRIEQRIKELERMQERATVEHEGKGYTYREDTDENRAMFFFPGKPDEETRALLKRHAFKWSPSRDAWVRQLTNAAIYAAKLVRSQLDTIV